MTANQLYNSIPSDQQGAAMLVLSAFRYISDLGLSPEPVATATPATPPGNVSDDKLARLRAKIVADVWEPDLRSDLVDRIVETARLGWADAKTIQAVVSKATKAKDLYETSEGQRGKDSNWKTLSTWCKGVFERNGRKWKPTSSAVEPRPRQPRVAPADLAEVAADAEGQPDAKPAGRLNVAGLKGLLDGYRVFEKEKKQAQQ